MTEQSWLEELALDKCLHLMRQFTVGRIAVDAEGGPIVLPVNYRLVEAPGRTWIALRTRPGNVIDTAPMQVAFQLDAIDPVHHEGWSVLVRGTLHPIDKDAAVFGEQFDPEPWLTAERDAWRVIEPFAITGRRLHTELREWAFNAQAYV
jgi:hypothetical protein